MRAAVIGAAGSPAALVPVLARRAEVVVISRRGSAPEVPGVRALVADVTGSLCGALDEVDVAYYLVHSLGSRGFSALDRRAAENVAAEAERAGVSQILILAVPVLTRGCPPTGCTSSRPSARMSPVRSSSARATRRWRATTASGACSRSRSRASATPLGARWTRPRKGGSPGDEARGDGGRDHGGHQRTGAAVPGSARHRGVGMSRNRARSVCGSPRNGG